MRRSFRQVCGQSAGQLMLCLSMIAPNTLLAATWQFKPTITATETYYDNISLRAHNKNKEFVSQITPSVSLSANGRRLKLNSKYSLGYINYWGSEFADRYTTQGSLNGRLEMIKKHFFINAAASVSEQVVDPTKTSAINAQTVTTNRTETRSATFMPSLINRFGRYADSFLSYSYSRVDYSSSQVGSSYSNSVNYALSSGKWFNKFTWIGNISLQNGQQSNADNYQANARINYVVTKQWTLFVTGLAQRINYINTRVNNSHYFVKNEAGISWRPSRKVNAEAGGGAVLNAQALGRKEINTEQVTWFAKIILTPTSRTSIEVGREQAIFGRRIFSRLSHYTRKTKWSSIYAETLTTPQQARNISLNPDNPDNLNNASDTTNLEIISLAELDRQVTNDVILRKRLDANGSIRRKKVNLTGNVFFEKGEYQTSNQTDKRYGGSAGIQVTLSRRLTGSTNSSLQRYYFNEQSRIDNIYSTNIALKRKLGKKANVSLTYIWQKRATNSDEVNYTSNQVIAQISLAL